MVRWFDGSNLTASALHLNFDSADVRRLIMLRSKAQYVRIQMAVSTFTTSQYPVSAIFQNPTINRVLVVPQQVLKNLECTELKYLLSSALRTPKVIFDVRGIRIMDSNRRDHALMALRNKQTTPCTEKKLIFILNKSSHLTPF